MEILKHVYFVRHGQSDSNADGIYRGAQSMLTEEGKTQAEAVAERVVRLDVDALIASHFPRARDTAAAIERKTGLTAEVSELFGEWREASAIHGRHKEDPEVVAMLRAISSTDDHDFRHSDEENFAELHERSKAALALLEQREASRICVVTHGAFLRVLFGTIVFGDAFTRAQFQNLISHLVTSNTGVGYVRLSSDRGWQSVSWNDSTHLG